MIQLFDLLYNYKISKLQHSTEVLVQPFTFMYIVLFSNSLINTTTYLLASFGNQNNYSDVIMLIASNSKHKPSNLKMYFVDSVQKKIESYHQAAVYQ